MLTALRTALACCGGEGEGGGREEEGGREEGEGEGEGGRRGGGRGEEGDKHVQVYEIKSVMTAFKLIALQKCEELLNKQICEASQPVSHTSLQHYSNNSGVSSRYNSRGYIWVISDTWLQLQGIYLGYFRYLATTPGDISGLFQIPGYNSRGYIDLGYFRYLASVDGQHFMRLEPIYSGKKDENMLTS